MKIYTKLVVDIASDSIVSDASFEHAGNVALASGGSSGGQKSSPGYVLPGLLPGIQSAAQNSIVNPAMGNPMSINYVTSTGNQGMYTVPQTLTALNTRNAINQIRGGYAARGLANSGQAIAGEQNAIGQLALQGQQQQATNLTNLLGAGNGQNSSTKQSSGMSVVCTEFYNKGLMDERTFQADNEYGKLLPTEVIQGYHSFGVPLAKLVRRSKLVAWFLRPLVLGWAQEMRHRLYADCPGKLWGKFLLNVGVPVCGFIGKIIRLNEGGLMGRNWL